MSYIRIYILFSFISLLMFGCSSGTTSLHTKSDAALRAALSEKPEGSFAVLASLEQYNESVRNDLKECGVIIVMNTKNIVSLSGTQKELNCIAEKPYVLGLELSKSNKIQ